MSWALQNQFGLKLWSSPGRVVMQLLETNRPDHRSDTSAARWAQGHIDATDRASVQAREEMSWEPVAMV